MSPSSERLIARTVARLLAGEGAAINYIPAELRPLAHARYIDGVRAGEHDRAVFHDLAPH